LKGSLGFLACTRRPEEIRVFPIDTAEKRSVARLRAKGVGRGEREV
jgi:hypothetical protein